MSVTIAAIEAENIRGHTYARLDLTPDRILLVGRNNSGKTSALLLLNWLFNLCKYDVLEDKEGPSNTDLDVLLPARETRNKARRLTLYVHIADGRRHQRFKCDEHGIAAIRIGIRISPRVRLFAKLGDPTRGETIQSDEMAIRLLKEVRKKFRFEHIPSFRDAASTRFQKTQLGSFRRRLSERVLHARQAGAPREYREIIKAQDSLKGIAENLVKPLWEEMQSALPTEMVRDAAFELICEPQDLVEWMAQHLTFRVSTGEHDEQKVNSMAVGSGLQSLLDIAITISDARNDDATLILAVEEPEAFLHPSAQRAIARQLFASSVANKLMMTTHSPIVVEEAHYDHVVVTRDHCFYQPQNTDGNRDEINTALLTGYGAEMIFARSVLFVEGEGDRQFFEMLRRRIAEKDTTGNSDQLFVVPVGGNSSFAPWMRLAQSYGDSSNRPIRWTVIGDSDAVAEIRRAFKDAKITIPREALELLSKVQTNLRDGQLQEWIDAARKTNSRCAKNSIALRLLPGDLEFAILQQASTDTLRHLAKKADHQFTNKDNFIQWLGSKAITGSSRDNAFKAPWFRGVVGKQIPAAEIHNDVKKILKTWLGGVMSETQARKLLASL